MALDALNTRMGGVLIRRVFRLHYCVATLSAERNRVHVSYCPIGELAPDDDVCGRRKPYEGKQPPQLGVLEIQRRKTPRVRASPALAAEPQINSDWDHGEPGNEQARQDQ